jgi:hypothetical protein
MISGLPGLALGQSAPEPQPMHAVTSGPKCGQIVVLAGGWAETILD